jgi:hypothetical protein
MKRVLLIVIAALVVVAISSCTKEGPQGPPGKDGQNANATCGQCHNFSDSIVAKIMQYNNSQHATGTTTFENAAGCSPCHTSQGFTDVIVTGDTITSAGAVDPAAINCRTCHKIHETYTNTDWALRFNGPVNLRIGGTLDLAGGSGTADACAQCHQPRKRYPFPDDSWVLDSIKITSSRYNPHYGTQSTILAGMGAFQLPGSTTYANSPHRDALSCTDCHGGTAVGIDGGGHTLRMAFEQEGSEAYNTQVCAGCHSDIGDNFDYDGVQTEIQMLEDSLKNMLVAKGWITSSGSLVVPQYFTKTECQVIWNWGLVHYDRSLGVHNYKYSRDILQSGIDWVGAN